MEKASDTYEKIYYSLWELAGRDSSLYTIPGDWKQS